jgi:plastocyanin
MVEAKGRVALTISVVCAVGIITGLFLGGAILPFHAAEQQYVKNDITATKSLNIVHADEVNTLHAHIVTTVVTVTETSPHGYIHDFASTLAPGVFANKVISAPGQAPNEIWIWAREYHPNSLTVPIGTNVTWINKDTEEHTVSSTAGLFGGSMPILASYSFMFTQPGTYTYFCEPHPIMLGVIIVK